MEKLLTLEEVTVYLGLPEEQVVRLVEAKRLPAYKVGGSFLRFRKDQVDAAWVLIEKGLAAKTAQAAPAGSTAPAGEAALALAPEALRREQWQEWLYASDFYLACGALLVVMLLLLVVL